MPWNGAGTFTRLYSWVADRIAGLDISSTRMDADTNDIVATGLGNCLTRDGQGIATANLPMGGFRHTGVGNGQSVTDYAAMGQLQNGLVNWTLAGGTSDALTATYTPTITALIDGQLFFIRALASNATTQPTFQVNGLTAQVITKGGGQALGIGDIAGGLQELILRYNLANTRFELLNPFPSSGFSTGDVKQTLKAVADTGWIMMNDGTIGNVSSGATYANANAQALYLLLWNNISNTWAPVTGGRGASASADWAAQKSIALTKVLGRSLAVAGSGSGLSARSLGQTTGEEAHVLQVAELPNASLSVTTNGSGNFNSTQTDIVRTSKAFLGNLAAGGIGVGLDPSATNQTSSVSTAVNINSTGTTSAMGSNQAHNNMQPTSFMNVMIKL